MKNYIPDSITDAEKKGFSAPDSSWFKGESIEFVKKIYQIPQNPLFEYLDFSSIQHLFNEHISENKTDDF